MPTLTEILARAEVLPADDILAALEVPVLSGPQRQGDVLIVPGEGAAWGDLIPPAGVAVVRGEATGNSHVLHADGPCAWAPGTDDGLVLGHLHVPGGAVAWLIHTEEHGANGIGPGGYELRGKRELADEIRRVAD